jgi:integrase
MVYHVAIYVANALSPRAVADYTRRSRSDNPMARARHGSYLFQRPGSSNYYIKLRSPGEKRKELSLGTPDRREAEVLAGPMITAHKAALLAARPHLQTVRKLEPGEHPGPDGGKIVANERELIYLNHNGAYLRTESNAAQMVVPPYPQSSARAVVKFVRSLDCEPRPTVAVKNGDDAIFETYLQHANVTGYYEREARATWALFKSLCDNKPLKDATRDDGRKVVQHFEAQVLKSASIRKKIGWLVAAVNLAIREGRLRFNPFVSIVPKRDDKVIRLPLDEADMKACRRNLDKLDEADALLFRLLAATGMRLSEAFEIEGEMKERGVRYVIVGHKTEQSKRRVPIPACVLPYLPKVIKGPPFVSKLADPADTASKHLNLFLNDCGIVDPRKVIHSLRHRAQDRLRAAGCPEDVRWALLGHEEKTVAAGYGEGFPVPLLRKWVDKIGGM